MRTLLYQLFEYDWTVDADTFWTLMIIALVVLYAINFKHLKREKEMRKKYFDREL